LYARKIDGSLESIDDSVSRAGVGFWRAPNAIRDRPA
jgi:hypothetical protein